MAIMRPFFSDVIDQWLEKGLSLERFPWGWFDSEWTQVLLRRDIVPSLFSMTAGNTVGQRGRDADRDRAWVVATMNLSSWQSVLEATAGHVVGRVSSESAMTAASVMARHSALLNEARKQLTDALSTYLDRFCWSVGASDSSGGAALNPIPRLSAMAQLLGFGSIEHMLGSEKSASSLPPFCCIEKWR